jgi:DNA polymerase/3'-5' exonuclease PolX
MKVAQEDGFRIRSYERAAEAIESLDQQLADIYQDPLSKSSCQT